MVSRVISRLRVSSPRRTTTTTTSPTGPRSRFWASSAGMFTVAAPSMVSTTSPAFMPASSAGMPGSTRTMRMRRSSARIWAPMPPKCPRVRTPRSLCSSGDSSTVWGSSGANMPLIAAYSSSCSGSGSRSSTSWVNTRISSSRSAAASIEVTSASGKLAERARTFTRSSSPSPSSSAKNSGVCRPRKRAAETTCCRGSKRSLSKYSCSTRYADQMSSGNARSSRSASRSSGVDSRELSSTGVECGVWAGASLHPASSRESTTR